MGRQVCADDLRNYFRKKDLLGGLTEMEQAIVRQNLGITLDNGSGYVETTYKGIISKIQNKQLITGTRYLITDYQTIYQSNNKVEGQYQTWGLDHETSPIMPLLVQAASATLLDPRAIAVDHPEWIIEYDVVQKTFEDGSKNKGTILYLKDTNNNAACYDFKNVKFKRDSKNYYTFSYLEGSEIKDASEITDTHDNILGEGCWNNVFLGDTYYNVFHPDCIGNTFNQGCHNNIFHWKTVDNTFNEVVCYTSGSIYNITTKSGDTTLSTAITKTIHKSNDTTLVVYLDPITYALQYSTLK